jgi:hypothetical protein
VPKIAISYRRSDGSAVAGRIYDWLAARYGADSVFMDVEKIPLGVDFRAYIKSVLSQSDLILAIVGPGWCFAAASQNRFADPDDPVRVEIETALQQGTRIIPVLVDGANMPAVRDLPDSLKTFPFLNATWIDAGRDFRLHMNRLIEAIEERESVMLAQPKRRGPAALLRPRFLVASAFAALVILTGTWTLLPHVVPPAPPRLASDRTVILPKAESTQAKPPSQEAALGGIQVAPAKVYRVVSELSDDVLNLRDRAGARDDNPPSFHIPKGAPGISLSECRRLDDGALWCAATWNGRSGWLNARYIIEIDMGAVAAGSAARPPDQLYEVANGIAGGKLHIRAAPSISARTLKSVPEGTAGIQLGPCHTNEQTKWCFATWDGITGWIDARFVSPVFRRAS